MLINGNFRWVALALYFPVASTSWAQEATPSLATPVQSSSTDLTDLQAFQANQQALAQSLNAVLAQGGTLQQLQAWQQQNASALATQQQLALNMAGDSALQPQPAFAQPNIPANASQTLKDFLTTQSALMNARAQIHNQLLSAMPTEVSAAQLSQMEQSEIQLFQQQHAADIQAQQQRAQTLANESAQQTIPLPPPLVIPAGTSPQRAAFLTAKDQLLRDRITFLNQYVTAAPDVRQAAMIQWLQQHASRFQQVQALAQNLSTATSTTQN